MQGLKVGECNKAIGRERRQYFLDNLDLFAIEKGELTMAEVEPFKIELEDPRPYADKFLRYKPSLT